MILYLLAISIVCGHDDEKREWHVDVKQDLLALESRSDVNVRNTKFQDQFNCMVSLSNLSRIMTTEFYYSSRVCFYGNLLSLSDL